MVFNELAANSKHLVADSTRDRHTLEAADVSVVVWQVQEEQGRALPVTQSALFGHKQTANFVFVRSGLSLPVFCQNTSRKNSMARRTRSKKKAANVSQDLAPQGKVDNDLPLLAVLTGVCSHSHQAQTRGNSR